MSKDAPDKFLITEGENKNTEKESISNVGVGSEEEAKNINPDLEIRG